MTASLCCPILRCVINLLVFFMKHPKKNMSVLLYWQELGTASVVAWIINSWSWHINARRPKGWWKNSSEMCKSKFSQINFLRRLNITVFLAGWYILLLAQNNETSCCMFKNVQPGTIWMRIHISSVPRITFHHFWTQAGQKYLFWEEFSATSLYCYVHRLQGHNAIEK